MQTIECEHSQPFCEHSSKCRFILFNGLHPDTHLNFLSKQYVLSDMEYIELIYDVQEVC